MLERATSFLLGGGGGRKPLLTVYSIWKKIVALLRGDLSSVAYLRVFLLGGSWADSLTWVKVVMLENKSKCFKCSYFFPFISIFFFFGHWFGCAEGSEVLSKKQEELNCGVTGKVWPKCYHGNMVEWILWLECCDWWLQALQKGQAGEEGKGSYHLS